MADNGHVNEKTTHKLTPAEYVATEEKIAKINQRATKRGFTGRLAVEAEKVVEDSVDAFGFPKHEVFYRVAVTGEAPAYNGWKFLARVDALPNDQFTLAAAPGVEGIDRSLVKPGHCDHCDSNRNRKNTYLVQSTETGEVKNVGSTCIKDFLGWSGTVVFYTEKDIEGEFESLGGILTPRSYDARTIIAYAYAATKVFGFVRSGDWNARPTKDVVWSAIDPISSKDRELAKELAPMAAEATSTVDTVIEFVQSEEFGNGDYALNARAALAGEYVTSRQMGLLASLPQAYFRATEKVAKAAEKAAEKPVSQHVGNVKDKVVIEVEISGINWIEGDWGTTTLYTLTDTEGNVFKWFSTSGALGEEKGRTLTLKGTVKGHDEWQGQKQTVLTRCKEIA